MNTVEDLLEPGQRIWVAGSSNEPTAAIEALAAGGLPADLTWREIGFHEAAKRPGHH